MTPIPILGPCTCTVCTVQYTMCHMHRCNVQWSTHKAWPHPQLDFGLWCTIHSELCACPQPWLMLVHFGHRRVHFVFLHVSTVHCLLCTMQCTSGRLVQFGHRRELDLPTLACSRLFRWDALMHCILMQGSLCDAALVYCLPFWCNADALCNALFTL